MDKISGTKIARVRDYESSLNTETTSRQSIFMKAIQCPGCGHAVSEERCQCPICEVDLESLAEKSTTQSPDGIVLTSIVGLLLGWLCYAFR
jgi:hypothetical protein